MIREACIQDATAIGTILISAWQTAYNNIIDPKYSRNLNLDRYIRIMTENIEQEKEKIFVADKGGRVQGFASVKLSDGLDDCELIGLYVDPNFQQKGIGGLLLITIKDYCKERGYKTLLARTLQDAYNNQFYLKHGGVAVKHTNITLGSKSYPAVGFVFFLE